MVYIYLGEYSQQSEIPISEFTNKYFQYEN